MKSSRETERERDNGLKYKRTALSYKQWRDGQLHAGKKERESERTLHTEWWRETERGSAERFRLLYGRSPPMERKKCSSAPNIHLTQGRLHGEYKHTHMQTHMQWAGVAVRCWGVEGGAYYSRCFPADWTLSGDEWRLLKLSKLSRPKSHIKSHSGTQFNENSTALMTHCDQTHIS